MTIRKITGWTAVIVFITLISFFVIRIIDLQEIKIAKEKQMDKLPDYCFIDIYDNAFCTKDFEQGKPIILILFDPYCPSCEQEINGIYQNREIFQNISLAMITMSDKESCRRFYITHKLNEIPNLHVLRDTTYHFIQLAGMVGAPETFVYNEEKELLHKFTGEVKATTLIQSIYEKK